MISTGNAFLPYCPSHPFWLHLLLHQKTVPCLPLSWKSIISISLCCKMVCTWLQSFTTLFTYPTKSLVLVLCELCGAWDFRLRPHQWPVQDSTPQFSHSSSDIPLMPIAALSWSSITTVSVHTGDFISKVQYEHINNSNVGDKLVALVGINPLPSHISWIQKKWSCHMLTT